ncbi:MAG: lamin tail domain-containing protein [Caldilineales bacterium]|nr:lamin tail domain-containing protein [Caldilineales bacterium]
MRLNEILPAPLTLDWDGDGQASENDEWIELYNGGDFTVDLAGWRLWRGEIGTDGLPDGYYYEFPAGSLFGEHGYLVVFKRQSDLFLPNSRGALHIVRPDGRIADSFSWGQFPGYDRSFSRYPDGTGPWGVVDISIGLPNRPFPEHEPQPTRTPRPRSDSGLGVGVEPIARAHELPLDERVTVEGQVTVPPGLFDAATIYIQDASAGIKLYLREGAYPDLQVGDRVRVSGYVREFHGQRELSVPGPAWLTFLSAGSAPRARYIRSGWAGEAFESRLVMVVGEVTGFRGNSFWLDDGSGAVQISVDEDLPWRRPYFNAGERWAVTGVVSEWDGKYRILPRFESDISEPPSSLPVTGER